MTSDAPGLRQRAAMWRNNAATRGLPVLMRAALRRLGIRCFLFHWIEEFIPAEADLKALVVPDGFRVVLLGVDEVATICQWSAEGAPIPGLEMQQHLRDGGRCIGLLKGDQIVGFSWYSIDRVMSDIWPVPLKPNEAYLFNMYIRPEMRGRQFAALLRQHTYLNLVTLGRDTCYSITLTINKQSWRFKQKLAARKVFTGLHLELIGRWRHSWVISRAQRSTT